MIKEGKRLIIKLLILGLFFPASIGIIWRIFNHDNLSHQLLAFAIFLMCLEQATMAVVDLENISIIKQKYHDHRLKNFTKVTMITIVIELLGFYVSVFDLYWGAILVLVSLIFFNLCAKVQLHPSNQIIIKVYGIPKRLPLLMADGLGLMLVILGRLQIVPLLMSSILCGMILIYGVLKYNPVKD